MRTDVEQVLAETFGFSTFRAGQEAVIEALVAGHSTLAVFPTGGGKSLCYQLPALLFNGMTLVVSPLIALMKDQIDFLVSRNVRAARLDSSLSAEESRQVWDDLWNQRLKVLYVAPERFGSERFIERLRRASISLMVIDEAHCISEWGHNFRPDYLKLAALAKELKVERVLSLTATATPAVAADICRSFSVPPEAYVNTGFHRPNLVMRVAPCTAVDRDALLIERLQSRPPGATIVYVTLQRTAEDVAAILRARELDAKAYHAGMEAEARHATQDWFMASPTAIVVATIAFGMGIDKADIRYVYHYNMPKSLENYAQETGRAGRDGNPASCDMLACPDDIATLENFTYGDTPTAEAVRDFVAHVLGLGDVFDVSVYELSLQFDIRTLVVSTLLTYLELEGALVSTGPFYDSYKFQPTRSSAEMFEGLDAERVAFLRDLFKRATKARTWFNLDVGPAARELEQPRKRIVAALNFLEERGDLRLQVSGVRRGYRLATALPDPSELAARLAARFEESERRDIARVAQVAELASATDCHVRRTLAYFGEELAADCGHCDRCLGEPVPRMPPAREPVFDEGVEALVREVMAENHEALASARQLTRFLCGLPSPAASRARPPLGRHRHFGACGHLPFKAVLEFVARCGA